MPTKTDAFSSLPNYYLQVYTSLHSQSVSGNYSRIYYRIRVYKASGDWWMATTNMGNSGWADSSIGGNPDLWRNTNLAFDFRNVTYITFAEGYFNQPHRADGTGSYYVNAGMTLYALGTARADSGTVALPRLAEPPPAPRPIGVDQITQTSLRYRFSGTGDGGSPILQWQIGWGTSSSKVQNYLTSSGTSSFTKLQPGTTYYFWSRGRNSKGWGPWSLRTAGRTVAGARVRHAGKWKEAVPYVRVNGVWRLAQPYVRRLGVWKKTG